MQGKIVKILGRRDSRTVMMEKDSEVPRHRVLAALLSTEDSNDSQKHMHAVLINHPTLAYPFFSLTRPLFLPQRGSNNRGSTVVSKGNRSMSLLEYGFVELHEIPEAVCSQNSKVMN